MIRSFALAALAWATATTAADRVAVGIPDFDHEGYGAAGVATAAHGLVQEEVSRIGSIVLVERSRLADVLDELTFQQSGVTDPDGATDVGRGHNVQLLLFGEVGRLGADSYSLSLRVVDVATNRVLRTDEIRVTGEGKAFDAAVRLTTRRLLAMALARIASETVLVPAASLAMGSDRHPEERPVHEVHVDSFYIDRTEVSRGAFAAYVESLGRPVQLQDGFDRPAAEVSWHDAAGYCGWVGKRLPTEAEWELATRGAEGRTFPWGEAPPSAQLARFMGSGREPVDVGDLTAGATPAGILNLSGNVGEWVADWYDPAYYANSPRQGPTGAPEGDFRVVRGGGFLATADELRGSARSYHNPERGVPDIGFRCAASTRARP